MIGYYIVIVFIKGGKNKVLKNIFFYVMLLIMILIVFDIFRWRFVVFFLGYVVEFEKNIVIDNEVSY